MKPKTDPYTLLISMRVVKYRNIRGVRIEKITENI
jgi:hypothetical protein